MGLSRSRLAVLVYYRVSPRQQLSPPMVLLP
jgi:hypothetical protein